MRAKVSSSLINGVTANHSSWEWLTMGSYCWSRPPLPFLLLWMIQSGYQCTLTNQRRIGKIKAHYCHVYTTCLFTRLESLAWSQQGFWLISFCRKRNLWSLCFDGRTKVKFLCIASMEKRKSGDKSIFHPFTFLVLPLSSRKAVKSSTTKLPPSKQRLHKLCFLQKLGCQNPCWDQARLCLAW